ncbi:MAG: hypothetical protein AAGG08_18990 [Actinomycetota bacterium]
MSAEPTLVNVTATGLTGGAGGFADAFGLSISGSSNIDVQHSTITGATASVRHDGNGMTTTVSNTHLVGPATDDTSPRTFTCVDVHDENLASLDATCSWYRPSEPPAEAHMSRTLDTTVGAEVLRCLSNPPWRFNQLRDNSP